MKGERKYKEPDFQIPQKYNKAFTYFFLVLRIALVLACIWGLFILFS